MRVSKVVFVCLLAVGCSPPPKVTEGKFTDSYELTMQRGSLDVVVKTSGPARYKITQHAMTHPMGSRPNTEGTFTTPAGTFQVSSHGDNDLGVIVNGVLYPEPSERGVRSKLVIDEEGGITVVTPPPAPAPEPNREPANKGATSK